jgi:ABC-2 type transport system ATP-binding protein
MAAIEVRGLTKRFGDVLAVDDLSFEVESGTVTGFLGPNGAGKTTTLRTLLGLVEPSAGSALINGRPYRELANRARQVGAALEGADLHPGRTARDHLRVRATAADIERARIPAVLDLVELTDAADRRAGGFSLGMRQRLALAAALLGDPEVLILDEPANGLDPDGVRWLRRLLRGLAAQGRTVLVSSHVLAEVAQTADRVVILNRGRLVTEAALEELMAGTQQVVRVQTPEAERLCEALAGDGVRARLVGPDRLEISGASAETVGTLAARMSIPLYESVTEVANLEDVFFQLTGAASEQEVAP